MLPLSTPTPARRAGPAPPACVSAVFFYALADAVLCTLAVVGLGSGSWWFRLWHDSGSNDSCDSGCCGEDGLNAYECEECRTATGGAILVALTVLLCCGCGWWAWYQHEKTLRERRRVAPQQQAVAVLVATTAHPIQPGRPGAAEPVNQVPDYAAAPAPPRYEDIATSGAAGAPGAAANGANR